MSGYWHILSSVACQAPGATPIMDVSKAHELFRHKSTTELFREYCILSVCRFTPLVNAFSACYQAQYASWARPALNVVLSNSLFKQFCGGPNLESLTEVATRLDNEDLGAMIDYASESTGEETEAAFDANIRNVEDSVAFWKKFDASRVKRVPPSEFERFSVVKLSAINRDEDLTLFSHYLNGRIFHVVESASSLGEKVRNVFADTTLSSDSGRYSKFDDFEDSYVATMQTSLDDQLAGFRKWCSQRQIPNAPEICERLAKSSARLDALCEYSLKTGVNLLVDAEAFAVQPAIDYLATRAMLKHNQEGPAIFNERTSAAPKVVKTYQMYLKGSLQRLEWDVRRVFCHSTGPSTFSAKLVRGAYLVRDRHYVMPTYEATSSAYDGAISFCIESLGELRGNQVLVLASHNHRSAQRALDSLETLFTSTGGNSAVLEGYAFRICFAQLFGMGDGLSAHLASKLRELSRKHTGSDQTVSPTDIRLACYKYVPYGPSNSVVPYLIRRSQENNAVLGSPYAALERNLVWSALSRRITGSSK